MIESTIKSDRYKKRHKAQWAREGAHNVLQIRASIASSQLLLSQTKSLSRHPEMLRDPVRILFSG